MLRLPLFASRQFNTINMTTVLFYLALGAASYLLVLHCELRLGYSAAQAVAGLIPESALFLIISPLSRAPAPYRPPPPRPSFPRPRCPASHPPAPAPPAPHPPPPP